MYINLLGFATKIIGFHHYIILAENQSLAGRVLQIYATLLFELHPLNMHRCFSLSLPLRKGVGWGWVGEGEFGWGRASFLFLSLPLSPSLPFLYIHICAYVCVQHLRVCVGVYSRLLMTRANILRYYIRHGSDTIDIPYLTLGGLWHHLV